ncbi:hypothetical protein PHYSODRAFT_491035 [Phytophthora sojae]|uniref:Uncharacterized protein n=1 Tax=Phytophthora sojae (strain P6497) TaxID=1094619 RepID=G4ZCD2_PHYSP|nr:hypothetical protein PHYSODRAFT_491035 [Phytophthora sojae]EGZ22160.1 hypothetical protein PHYSODRAFT_491035 [Phytophthora sojae]|eukprot:XP_009524877.1 hypothetical protein PHYSODRAFT_491035 [Phytophthora sojae]
MVCITKALLNHNHTLSDKVFSNYPRRRIAIPSEVVDTVNVLQKAGAKKKNHSPVHTGEFYLQAVTAIDKALAWLTKINFSIKLPANFVVQFDERLSDRLKALPLTHDSVRPLRIEVNLPFCLYSYKRTVNYRCMLSNLQAKERVSILRNSVQSGGEYAWSPQQCLCG